MHKTSSTSIPLQQQARFHTEQRAARLGRSFLFSKTTQQGLHTHDSLLKHPNINLFLPSLFWVLHPSLHPQCSCIWLSKGLWTIQQLHRRPRDGPSRAWPEDNRQCGLFAMAHAGNVQQDELKMQDTYWNAHQKTYYLSRTWRNFIQTDTFLCKVSVACFGQMNKTSKKTQA